MKALPPIPEEIQVPAGPIPVTRTVGLWDADRSMGKFNWFERTIELESELGVHAAWLTLEHERVHAIISDSGIDVGSEELEEQICNAVALARVAEMFR